MQAIDHTEFYRVNLGAPCGKGVALRFSRSAFHRPAFLILFFGPLDVAQDEPLHGPSEALSMMFPLPICDKHHIRPCIPVCTIRRSTPDDASMPERIRKG